jgi:spermidine/putrescine transport system permease protein
MSKKDKRNESSSSEWKGGPGYAVYVVLVFVFFYLPILAVMIFSFNASKSSGIWGGFSTKWYTSLFDNATLMSAVWVTLGVAVLATLISTLIGTFGAIGIAEMGKKQKGLVNFILSVNNLPVVNPDIVTAVSLSVLFIAIMRNAMGFTTMLLAHIAFCTPYVIIQVYPKVLALDPSEMEAAMDLGATKHQAIMKVVIPDLMPSILSGGMMAFTMSFDDFVISYFVGGNVQNISTYIYSMKVFNPVVNALSTLIFLFIGLALVAFEVLNSKISNTNSGLKNKRTISMKSNVQ